MRWHGRWEWADRTAAKRGGETGWRRVRFAALAYWFWGASCCKLLTGLKLNPTTRMRNFAKIFNLETRNWMCLFLLLCCYSFIRCSEEIYALRYRSVNPSQLVSLFILDSLCATQVYGKVLPWLTKSFEEDFGDLCTLVSCGRKGQIQPQFWGQLHLNFVHSI